MRHALATSLLALVTLPAAAVPAYASHGVALDTGNLEVEQKLTPGGGYMLPPLTVRNPGTEVTSYEIVVLPTAQGEGRAVPAAWFRFQPQRMTLKPGQTRKVRTRLGLPSNASHGDYQTLLAAQIAGKGKGTQLGAAAATKLTFTVESSTLLGEWWYRIRSWFSDNAPWTWLVPLLALISLAVWRGSRRFSLRLERRA